MPQQLERVRSFFQLLEKAMRNFVWMGASYRRKLCRVSRKLGPAIAES